MGQAVQLQSSTMAASSSSVILVLLLLVCSKFSSSFMLAPSPRSIIISMQSSSLLPLSSLASQAQRQNNFPRPLHPGGFLLLTLAKDCLSIVTYLPTSSLTTSMKLDANTVRDGKLLMPEAQLEGEVTTPSLRRQLRMDLLLVKPPNMESLWEWYAYTCQHSNTDLSWGNMWPTVLLLLHWVLCTLNGNGEVEGDKEDKGGHHCCSH